MTLFIFPQPVEHQLCLLYSVYCQNNRGSKNCPNDWPFCLIYNSTNSHQNHMTKGSFWSQHVEVLHILILCQHINCRLLHKMIFAKWPNIGTVRSTLQVVPSPQRRQENSCEKKMIIDWLFLCGDRSGIPREQNRELATTWASIYTCVHVFTTRLAHDAQPSISQLN